MALMVLCFSQCKKQNNEEIGGKVKVSCTIPINNGEKSDFTNLMDSGKINWSDGRECVYLAIHGSNPQIIELESWADGTPSKLEFEGEAAEDLITSGEEYDIWYFGHSHQLETPYYNNDGDSLTGSISNQTGRLEDLGYCHIAKTKVIAVAENGEVKLNLKGTLSNQIAIALLDLENVEELYGDAIIGTEYTLSYKGERYELEVTEDDKAKIDVESASGISYVVLLPNTNKETMIKHKKEDKTYAYTFHNGIKGNKLYYRSGIDGTTAEALRWEEMDEEEPDTPDTPDPEEPTAPTNLVATATGQTTISLTWDAVQNATSYKVYSNDNLIASGLTATTYTVGNLAAGTEYCYYVTAVNKAGESEASTVACATTMPSNPNPPFTVNGATFKMIKVEGNGNDISDYYIGETEVTQELWQAVMGSNPSNFSGNPQRPVEKVSWNDCQDFIAALNELTGENFRLPNSLEWKYAAKGGNKSNGYPYSGSNTVGDVAWYDGNSDNRTHDVKTLSPNELGIYDMSGNVQEWTKTTSTGGFYRFYGGAFCHKSDYCTVTYSSYTSPSTKVKDIGFRLCATTITNSDTPEEPAAPTAPTNLVATATGQTTISLTWDAVQNATSYKVYNNGNLVVSDLTATTYTVEGLTAGTEYCYYVTAVNEAGESAASTSACATTEDPEEPEEPTAPAAPTNLVATATGQTTISLSWDAVQNATSYNVYNGETVVVEGLTAISYTVEGLTAGTQYCYNVTAVNEAGESDYSTEACAITESAPTAPAAPTNLVATANGQTEISLSWAAVQNATNYNVYNGETLVVEGLTVTSYTVEGLTAGTDYCYNVTAVNEIGESEHSTEACATTEEAPIVIETITVNGVSFNMIQVDGGTFRMGSVYDPLDGITDCEDETPAHNVTLTTYSIGETVVTQELYTAVMGSNPSHYNDKPQRPVECVTWDDCQTFITKLNELTGKKFRLPTEAEWEYAARGGNRSKGYMYSGSNDVDEVAWYLGNKDEEFPIREVKLKKANELGIYDMSGNVWEWCNDYYGRMYYSESPAINPQGPDQAETSTKHRVCRGGDAGHNHEYLRVAKRNSLEQAKYGSNYGFRLCLPKTIFN